jgi:heptosyltransferase II
VAHLVFQTAFPGDLFLSVPLIRRIRDWDPQTPITLACRPGLGEFFLQSGLVNEVIEIDKRSGPGRRQAMQKIWAQEWDVVFVPHESVRTALWMSKVRARRAKIGFRKWWNWFFYSMRVSKPMEYPDALRQLSLLTPLDGRLGEMFGDIDALRSPESQSPVDFSSDKIPDWASMTLGRSGGGKRIFFAPGSVWNTKRWKAKGYEALAQLLLERGFSIELVGSPAERALCDQIAAAVPGVINHAGQTTLGGLVGLFAHGAALVCNDSGAMHAAAVAGLPTVAIFGPTVLSLGFRPWQNRAMVIQRPLICRPCGKHGAQVCPIGTHECMESISPAEVLAAVESLIGASKA